jgi:hypothetical protein
MRGGVKAYRGATAAARSYLEADRSRADDYYLAEGTGIVRRFAAGPDGPVAELACLMGDGYEAWVAGLDPETGESRGRSRTDVRAVRFVEVTVNGPKSWSLVAELHPDVATAYEAAQDRAAERVIGWLGQHATTRVGPRGAQVAVPVERLEAVTVRHYTSRAGDPHRHLHLQMRLGANPAGLFDALMHRGQIVVHASEPERHAAIADGILAAEQTGRTVAVVVDTREQAATLNAAIRNRLVGAGLVDDTETTSSRSAPVT